MIGANRRSFPRTVDTARPFRKELSRRTWRAVRKLVKARDHYRCQVCGLPELYSRSRSGRRMSNLQVGHRIPAERYPGPHDDPANLWTLCRGCNASQGNRTPEEWRAARSGRLVRLGLLQEPQRPSSVIVRDYTRRMP